MRLVFMGTPDFAIPSLNILLDRGYAITAVVTIPDKPAGRGQLLAESPVKRRAIERGIHVVQPEKLGDPAFLNEMRSLQSDLFVVVAFRILPPELYGLPRCGAFNLHASLLPKYRGAAPINRAIMNGDHETGVTTFFLQQSVDTGNIILQRSLPIGENETAGELHDRLAELGAGLVLDTVRLIESGGVRVQSQDERHASRAPKIFREECRIDWNTHAEAVHNFIRGLSPRPCAYTHHHGTMIKMFRSRKVSHAGSQSPGTVIEADDTLIIATARDAVEVLELQQEGKNRLGVREFIRGHRISKGELLA